jgi:ribosomal protein S1
VVIARVAASLQVLGDKKKAAVSGIEVGSVLKGSVRRVESFGVFVDLAAPHAGVAGLCHLSEAADMFIKDLTKVCNLDGVANLLWDGW